MSRPQADPRWLATVACSPLNGRRGQRKLALVGASAPPGEVPPLEDPSWDVWSCNALWHLCRDARHRLRADAWFELHPLSAQTPQELQDMEACPVPLYTLEATGAPHWVPYPLEEVRGKFGDRDFFACTFSYQIALALCRGYTTIGLFGVELMGGSPRERVHELVSVTYWLGLARGMGVEVFLPDYSRLLWHPLLYGYSYQGEDAMVQADLTDLAQAILRDQRKKARPHAQPV